DRGRPSRAPSRLSECFLSSFVAQQRGELGGDRLPIVAPLDGLAAGLTQSTRDCPDGRRVHRLREATNAIDRVPGSLDVDDARNRGELDLEAWPARGDNGLSALHVPDDPARAGAL